MNLPNKLTVLRICLIPLFLLFLYCDFIPHNFLIALLIFGFASFTDMLDGKIARERNLITDFGKFMDPLADKLLVISAMIAFVGLNLTPSIVVIIILAREFLVTSLRLVAANSGIVIAADKWGKYKTVSQMIWVCYIMLSKWMLTTFNLSNFAVTINYISYVLAGIVVFLTVYSGYNYLMKNKEVFLNSK